MLKAEQLRWGLAHSHLGQRSVFWPRKIWSNTLSKGVECKPHSLLRMPYKPMWEPLSESADSMKLKCFAEMSSFRWKFTTGNTSDRNLPCLLLFGLPVLWFQDVWLFVLESMEMLTLCQNTVSWCLGSLRTWDLWAVTSSAPTSKLAVLNRETQGGRTAKSFFAKDKALEHSLSHIFLLSWEERAVNKTSREKMNNFSSFMGWAGNWRTCWPWVVFTARTLPLVLAKSCTSSCLLHSLFQSRSLRCLQLVCQGIPSRGFLAQLLNFLINQQWLMKEI